MRRSDGVAIGDGMDLNENADLDTSQVEDARGSGGGGGRFGGGGFGGLPIPIGGGIGTILTVVVVLGMLLAGGTFGRSILGGDSSSSQGDNTNLNQKCAASNPDRLNDTDCRNVLYVNSIQAYWQAALPQTFGKHQTHP